MTDYGKAMAEFERLSKSEMIEKLRDLKVESSARELMGRTKFVLSNLYGRMISINYDDNGALK